MPLPKSFVGANTDKKLREYIITKVKEKYL